MELSNLEIAMLVSTSGVVDWWTFSDSFPHKWIDFSVDMDSTTFKALESSGYDSIQKVVSSEKWTNSNAFKTLLLEETRKIYDDTVLTLLQVIED